MLAAVDAVIPAIEVMDSRYNQPFRLPDSVADNAGAARVVLGAQGRRPDELVDLHVLGCLFRYRGGFETAAGGAVMGHPAAAVAWLANALAAHGERLEAGSIVLSGADLLDGAAARCGRVRRVRRPGNGASPLLLRRETSQTRGVQADRTVLIRPATVTTTRRPGEGRDHMPEVTILPDGLQVTAAEAETVLAALSRAGLRYRVGLQARRVRDLQGPTRARRGALRAPGRGQRAQRRPTRGGHLPELPCGADHQHRHRAAGGGPAPQGPGVRLPELGAATTRPVGAQPGDEERQKGNNHMSVMRLGYVHIRVTDLEEARDHYSNTLGMSVVHEEPGRLHLKCWDEWDHHSLVLEEGGVGLVKARLQVLVRGRPRRVREALFAVRRDDGTVQPWREHDRRRRRARHPALRAHPRAVLRHGVHRHRHRVDQPRGVAEGHAGSAGTGSTTP